MSFTTQTRPPPLLPATLEPFLPLTHTLVQMPGLELPDFSTFPEGDVDLTTDTREGNRLTAGGPVHHAQSTILVRRAMQPAASKPGRPIPPPRLSPLQPRSLHPAHGASHAEHNRTNATQAAADYATGHLENDDDIVRDISEEINDKPAQQSQKSIRGRHLHSNGSAQKSAKVLGISPLQALHQYALPTHSPPSTRAPSPTPTAYSTLPPFPCQREHLTPHRILHDSAQKQSSSPRSLSFSLSRRKPFKRRDFVLSSLLKPAYPNCLSSNSGFTSPTLAQPHSDQIADLEFNLGQIRDPMIPAACVHSFKMDETQEWERLILTPGSYVAVVDTALVSSGARKRHDAWFLRLSGIALKEENRGSKTDICIIGEEQKSRLSTNASEGRHAEWIIQLRSKTELRLWQVTIRTLIRALARAEQQFRRGGTQLALSPYAPSPYTPKSGSISKARRTPPSSSQPFSPSTRKRFGEQGWKAGSFSDSAQISTGQPYTVVDVPRRPKQMPEGPTPATSHHEHSEVGARRREAEKGYPAVSDHPPLRPRASSLHRRQGSDPRRRISESTDDGNDEEVLQRLPPSSIRRQDAFEEQEQIRDSIDDDDRRALQNLMYSPIDRSRSDQDLSLYHHRSAVKKSGQPNASTESLALTDDGILLRHTDDRGNQEQRLLQHPFTSDINYGSNSRGSVSRVSRQPIAYDVTQRRPSAAAETAPPADPKEAIPQESFEDFSARVPPNAVRPRSGSQGSPFSLANVRASMVGMPPARPPPASKLPIAPPKTAFASQREEMPASAAHGRSPKPTFRAPAWSKDVAHTSSASRSDLAQAGSDPRTPSPRTKPLLNLPTDGAHCHDDQTMPQGAMDDEASLPHARFYVAPYPSVPLCGTSSSTADLLDEDEGEGETEAIKIFSSIPCPSPKTPETPSDGTATVYSPVTPNTSAGGVIGSMPSRMGISSTKGSWDGSVSGTKRVSFASKVMVNSGSDGRRCNPTQDLPPQGTISDDSPIEKSRTISPTPDSPVEAHVKHREGLRKDKESETIRAFPARMFPTAEVKRSKEGTSSHSHSGAPPEGRHRHHHSITLTLSSSSSSNSSDSSSLCSNDLKTLSLSPDGGPVSPMQAGAMRIEYCRGPSWGGSHGPVLQATFGGSGGGGAVSTTKSLDGLGIQVVTVLDGEAEYDRRQSSDDGPQLTATMCPTGIHSHGQKQRIDIDLHRGHQIPVKLLMQQQKDIRRAEDEGEEGEAASTPITFAFPRPPLRESGEAERDVERKDDEMRRDEQTSKA